VAEDIGGGIKEDNKMKPYYVSIKDEFQEEKDFYFEELNKKDWKRLRESSELFLVHAYSHLFKIPPAGYEVFGDTDYKIKYSQFYLNLAIGLELLLKSILLKKGKKISFNPEKTIPFGQIIEKHLTTIFPKLTETTLEEIKYTLKLVNLRRNNIAHRSKRSRDSYLHEHKFSYITLYIYEKFFYGENQELTALLLKSIDRSRVTQGSDFKPPRIKPRSLRG
jgi:hypothetical protein